MIYFVKRLWGIHIKASRDVSQSDSSFLDLQADAQHFQVSCQISWSRHELNAFHCCKWIGIQVQNVRANPAITLYSDISQKAVRVTCLQFPKACFFLSSHALYSTTDWEKSKVARCLLRISSPLVSSRRSKQSDKENWIWRRVCYDKMPIATICLQFSSRSHLHH